MKQQQQSFLSCNRFDIPYEKEEKEFCKVFVKETKSYLHTLIIRCTWQAM